MNMQRLFFIIGLLLIILIVSCQEDDLIVDTPCIWGVEMESFAMDSCFFPETTVEGYYVIPPTTGKELYRIVFDPSDDDGIYLSVWPRTGLGGRPNCDLYRLDLCENITTYVMTLEGLGNHDLLLNSKGHLFSGAMGDGFSIYDITNQESISEDFLDVPNIQDWSWADDNSVWVSYFVATNTLAPQRWVLFDLSGNPIDTLSLSSGRASKALNGKSIFRTFNANTLVPYLYIYDLELGITTDSIPAPQEFGLPLNLSNPQWLDEDKALLHTTHMIAIGDFSTSNYQVLKELPSDCDNYQISSVRPVPNRPSEIVYVLNQYFYDEEGVYQKRHDLVHFNIETGEENVIIVE